MIYNNCTALVIFKFKQKKLMRIIMQAYLALLDMKVLYGFLKCCLRKCVY